MRSIPQIRLLKPPAPFTIALNHERRWRRTRSQPTARTIPRRPILTGTELGKLNGATKSDAVPYYLDALTPTATQAVPDEERKTAEPDRNFRVRRCALFPQPGHYPPELIPTSTPHDHGREAERRPRTPRTHRQLVTSARPTGGGKTYARWPLYLSWASRASIRALPMNSPYRLTGHPDLRTSRS